MSLEQALERNTEMMADLIRALEGFQPATQAPAKTEVAPPKPVEPVATPVAQETKVAKPETAQVSPSDAAIEYAQVAKAITDTFKIDKVKVVAALAKFGAAKGPQLKVADYAAFLEELAA